MGTGRRGGRGHAPSVSGSKAAAAHPAALCKDLLGLLKVLHAAAAQHGVVCCVLRKWQGMDFVDLETKVLRNGAYAAALPVIRNELTV